MSGNVVPFPRPPLPPEKGVRQIIPEERLITRCEGLIHVYGEVPGRCQCGERWWDGSTGEGVAEETPKPREERG